MTANPHRRTGFSVLVVEDEFLIGLDIQDTLQTAGYRVLGPARRVSEALEILRHATPDVAVLDVNIHGDHVTPVAQLLKIMGVPFVLTTADENLTRSQAILTAAENLGKPTDNHRLLQSLEILVTENG